MNDEVADLLRTGTIRGIAYGTTKEDVIAILGRPPVDTPVHRTSTIWRYGRLEITFVRDAPSAPSVVVMLALYLEPGRQPVVDAERTWLDEWPADDVRLADVEAQAPVEPIEALTVPGKTTAVRVVASGVQLFFDEPDGRLTKIIATSPLEGPPA